MESSRGRPPQAARFTFKDGFQFGLGFFTAGLIFTIVVLLLAVVVSGVFTSMMVPKFVDTRAKAYESAMKSDLRNLAAAQEAHFADYLTYTDELGALDFNASNGVTITIWESSGQGWRATAEHSAINTICEIYFGSVAAPRLASAEGVVDCE